VIPYIDASILLRIVLGQSDALREWRDADRGVSSARITTECLRTLNRLRVRAKLPDKEAAARRAAISISDRLAGNRGGRFCSAGARRTADAHKLGTQDAIHLATALLWRESFGAGLAMATHDSLANAARAHGMEVVGVAW
jgi:predicted nucleic acid-binding protein